MELKLGKMTSKELAAWFGISYGSYRVCKKEKLGELSDYAEFDEIYGGVLIKKIRGEGSYIKEGRKSKEIVLKAFDEEWSETGLDTCSSVAIKIYDKHRNELTIAPTTTYNYTVEARNELYGKPFGADGKLGNCRYIWVKATDQRDGTKLLELFNEEEEKIKRDLMNKYFSTDAEKEVMVAEMVNRGELTKEEAYDTLVEMKHLNNAGFMAFKAELEEKIGYPVLKGTYIEKKQELIEWKDKDIDKEV